MGTYERPGGNIDKSFQAANVAMSNFNKQLVGIYDSLNKNYQLKKNQMRKLREKNMLRYEKEYATQLTDTPDTPYDALDVTSNNELRHLGDLYAGTLRNQSLNPDDENYMSYKDAADMRATIKGAPGTYKGVVNAMTVYGEEYRKAKLIAPGKPGSLLEDGAQDVNHIMLLDDLVNTGGKYIKPTFDTKTGDWVFNYDDGENSFSINSNEISNGARDGNAFFETTGSIKDMIKPVFDDLSNQTAYDKPLKLTKDDKYEKTTSVQYSGEGGANDRLNKAAEKYSWEGTLESHKMKNIWNELRDNAFNIEGTIKIGGKEMTGEAAFKHFEGQAWVGAGEISLNEDGTPSLRALEQREFAKQMFVSYMNQPENGFMKQDIETSRTEKYVSSGSGSEGAASISQVGNDIYGILNAMVKKDAGYFKAGKFLGKNISSQEFIGDKLQLSYASPTTEIPDRQFQLTPGGGISIKEPSAIKNFIKGNVDKKYQGVVDQIVDNWYKAYENVEGVVEIGEREEAGWWKKDQELANQLYEQYVNK